MPLVLSETDQDRQTYIQSQEKVRAQISAIMTNLFYFFIALIIILVKKIYKLIKNGKTA